MKNNTRSKEFKDKFVISHRFHSANGAHSIFLSKAILEEMELRAGQRVRIEEVEDGAYLLQVIPSKRVKDGDAIINDYGTIWLGNSPYNDIFLECGSGRMQVDILAQGYALFSKMAPRVFTKRGRDLLPTLALLS